MVKRAILIVAATLTLGSCASSRFVNDRSQCDYLPADQYFECVEYFDQMEAEKDSLKRNRFDLPFPNF